MERLNFADGEFFQGVHNSHGGGGASGTLLERMERFDTFGADVFADLRVRDCGKGVGGNVVADAVLD